MERMLTQKHAHSALSAS